MRTPTKCLTALLMSVAFLSYPVAAQETNSEPSIAPGARVRFTVADVPFVDVEPGRRLLLQGQVVEVRGDSLTVRFGGGAQMTVGRFAVGDLAISRGTQRAWQTHRTSAALNTLVMAAGIVTLARWPEKPSPSSMAAGARSPSIVPMAALVTLHALTFGRAALKKTERWEPVTK